MSSQDPMPRRIEWTGPEGWIVWTDEDGSHVRSPKGDGLEMPDVEQLFSLWSHARAMADADHIPAPKPPSRDELRMQVGWRSQEQAMRRAVRAVQREFDATNPPF